MDFYEIRELCATLTKRLEAELLPQRDLEKFAAGIGAVALALKLAGLSKGQCRAAILAICGVQVDDSLVRHLMRFQ